MHVTVQLSFLMVNIPNISCPVAENLYVKDEVSEEW